MDGKEKKTEDMRLRENNETVVRFELEAKKRAELRKLFCKVAPASLFNGSEQRCNWLLLSVDRQLL